MGDLGDLEREASLQEESCAELEPELGLLQALEEREFMLRLMVTPPDLFADEDGVGVFTGLDSRELLS